MRRSPAIVLASASPRRRELLALFGLPFEVAAPREEEALPPTHSRPVLLARRLALAKARAVAAERPDSLVIGADTIVVLGKRLLGKPSGEDEARRMLRDLSGRSHRVVTAVALIDTRVRPRRILAASRSAVVRMRRLHPAEIDAYVRGGEPLDKAGAYAVQGEGALLVDGVSGDYTTVVGLPVTALLGLLRRVGVEILAVGNPAAGVEPCN